MDTEDKTRAVLPESPLSGTFEHALDPKKRMTVPAVWREVMGSPRYVHVMADALDPCLTILPPALLQPRLQRLRQQALFEDGMSEALRDFFAEAECLMLDVQGRIRISDELLAFAQIEDQVVMRGLGVRIQIWAAKTRPRRKAIEPEAIARAAKALGF